MLSGSRETYPRRLEGVIEARLDEEPVVVVQGARTSGKSTLLRELAGARGAAVVDLDEPATRDAVAASPSTFARGEGPVFVDEYQHVPAILDSIKAELNRDLRPGRYVLTGSTRYSSLPAAAQSLAGRVHVMTLWPLSQGEIEGVRESFVERLVFGSGAPISPAPSSSTRPDYVARVLRGGLPLAVARSDGAGRDRWFDDYLSVVIERDVVDLSRIRQREKMPLLLAQLGGQTAQLLNVARAADAVGLEPSTAEKYVRLLEAAFIVHRLPAWGTTLRARAGSRPKIHFVDSGLAGRMLRASASRLAALEPQAMTVLGHLLETFCVGEVIKQVGWLPGPVHVGHWRTRDGAEVDLVLERDDGAVAAIEVKAGERVRNSDLRGMRTLRAALGDRFLAGVVLNLGPRAYPLEDRIHAAPVDRLWGQE